MRGAPVLRLALGAVAIISAAPALAQTALEGPASVTATDAAEEDGNADIVVLGESGNGTSLSADSLRDAAQAFQRHRAEFAPLATFSFVVEPVAGQPLGDIAVRLRSTRRNAEGGYESIALPIDADGAFVLPVDQVVSGRWTLRSSQRDGSIRIRPTILSPGNGRFNRRIGDVRLHCRVAMAFMRLGLIQRAAMGAIGPCGSSNVALYYGTPRPIVSASISGWNETLPVRDDRMSVRVPLHEDAIGNEQRLVIRLEPQ